MEQPTRQGRSEAMKPGFDLGVPVICNHQQPQIEQYLLRLGLGNAMPLVLADVTGIPVESLDTFNINHECIL